MAKNLQDFFYKNNRLQQLRGFCTVMQLGNISRAAEYMNLSHSAVSLQIKSLEDQLEINLFDRNGPNISPTEDAILLYQIANKHVEGINQVYNQFITTRDATEDNIINIAANNASINYILPKLLRCHLDAHPNIYSYIKFVEQEDGLKKLLKDEIDVLLLPRREQTPIDENFFEYIPLFYYTPVLLTLPDHPLAGKKNITIKDISEYEFTLPAKGLTVIPNLYEIFSRINIKKKFRVNFEGWEVTRKYIEAGLLISITADIVVERNDILFCTPLTHLFPVVDYGFIIKKEKLLPQKILNLIETARKNQDNIQSPILPK